MDHADVARLGFHHPESRSQARDATRRRQPGHVELLALQFPVQPVHSLREVGDAEGSLCHDGVQRGEAEDERPDHRRGEHEEREGAASRPEGGRNRARRRNGAA